MEERLQKILARAGYGSRRSAEEYITAGRVTVNGQRAILGTKADAERDDIRLDGHRIRVDEPTVYIALNKPRGVISDEGDRIAGRRTVFDLVNLPGHLFPVGRLDMDSEGLVLLTDDGELAHRLTHPRYEHDKEYLVVVEGRPEDEALERWRTGVYLDGQLTAPAEVTLLRQEGGESLLKVVLREGRKRQIRRLAAMLGYPVRRLTRVRIGPVRLGDLKVGEWRRLNAAELAELRQTATAPGRPRAERTRSAPRKPRPAAEGTQGEGRTRGSRPSASARRAARGEPAQPRRDAEGRGEGTSRGGAAARREGSAARGRAAGAGTYSRTRREGPADERPRRERGEGAGERSEGPRERSEGRAPREGDGRERPRSAGGAPRRGTGERSAGGAPARRSGGAGRQGSGRTGGAPRSGGRTGGQRSGGGRTGGQRSSGERRGGGRSGGGRSGGQG